MLVQWSPLFWTLLLFVSLWWASRRFAMYFVQTIYLLSGSDTLARSIYILVLLPGTIVHEVSHWLMAKVTGVPTGDVKLLPEFHKDGSVRLGYVEVGEGNLLQMALVGLAPLAVGSALTLWLSYGLVDVDALRAAWELEQWDSLVAVARSTFQRQDAFIGLFLLFSVSDAMFLSASDQAPIRQVLYYLGAILVPLYLLGILPALPADWTDMIQLGFGVFAYGLGVALLVHLTLVISFGGLYLVARTLKRS